MNEFKRFVPKEKIAETPLESKQHTELMGIDQQPSDAPMLIRGHHLKIFGSLSEGVPAIAIANAITRTTIDKRGEVSENDVEIWQRKPYLRTDARYGFDVVGETDEEAVRYRHRVKDVLTDFQKLPDDAPVKIVDGQKDGICNACTHGHHCTVRMAVEDGDYVRAFTAVAHENGLGEQVVVGSEEVVFDDRPEPVITETVETTAGAVREILTGTTLTDEVQRMRALRGSKS